MVYFGIGLQMLKHDYLFLDQPLHLPGIVYWKMLAVLQQ
jgi:hypothetical protein